MKRHKINRRYSEKMFSRNANRVHKKNLMPSAGSVGPMRGGIRL